MSVAALVVAAALALGSPRAVSLAEQHTTAGEAALEAGDDATAAREFAEAYRLLDDDQRTGEIAVMLVDEGVAASERAWERSGDAAHLEQARALLLAHAEDLERVPEASQRHREILHRLVEIDAKLGVEDPEVEPPKRARPPAPTVRAPDPDPPDSAIPDPERERLAKKRLAGLIVTPLGSALVVSGIGVLAFYMVQARNFSDDLRETNADFQSRGCDVEPSPACDELVRDIDFYRENGRRSNRIAVAGAVIGAFGLVATTVGVALLVSATRRLQRMDEVALRVNGGGLELRF